MKYFDFLLQNTIKPGKDGRLQFRPYGLFGRGYVIESDEQLRHIRRVVLSSYVLTMLVLIPAGGWTANSGIVRLTAVMTALGVVLIVPYVVWAHLQCRNMVEA